MIKRSFQLLEKVGPGKEKKILEQVNDWNSFMRAKELKGISRKNKLIYDLYLRSARQALHTGNTSFFVDKLPSTETWRLYPFFKGETCFLDIEVTGNSMQDDITMIGLFDGLQTKTMIQNYNLDIKCLKRELSMYKLIVTFNGSSFDIPFLKKRYKGLIPNIPHIDLRHFCNRLGYSGGLKEIEKDLGIKRENNIVERMYGGDPIKLWRYYKATGDEYYLKLLVEYNEEDVINLKTILDKLLKELKV